MSIEFRKFDEMSRISDLTKMIAPLESKKSGRFSQLKANAHQIIDMISQLAHGKMPKRVTNDAAVHELNKLVTHIETQFTTFSEKAENTEISKKSKNLKSAYKITKTLEKKLDQAEASIKQKLDSPLTNSTKETLINVRQKLKGIKQKNDFLQRSIDAKMETKTVNQKTAKSIGTILEDMKNDFTPLIKDYKGRSPGKRDQIVSLSRRNEILKSKYEKAINRMINDSDRKKIEVDLSKYLNQMPALKIKP